MADHSLAKKHVCSRSARRPQCPLHRELEALLVAAFGHAVDDGEGDVARMNIGQLADLRCNPGTPLGLLRRGTTGVPHEVVGDEHPASLKRVQ